MIESKELKRKENESEESFVWRIGNAKDNGFIDISWNEIADIVNSEFGYEDKPYTESAFRKPYQYAKRYYNAGVFDNSIDENHLEQIRNERIETEKNIIKFRDERNETKRIIRETARKESIADLLMNCVLQHKSDSLEYTNTFSDVNYNGNNDLIVSLTDIHTGIEIDNFCNKFNTEILKQRFNKYIDKIIEVKNRHESENVYIILSELVSGIIHNALRIESNLNLIQQFLVSMDYISDFLCRISKEFKTVNVYMCVGNHSRISPNKDDSLKGENIDHLAIPYLKAKLQNFTNIVFNENSVEESIAIFSVRGNIVMASHGDKDAPNNVVQKYTMMFNQKPDLVYLGHRHTNAMTTVYDTKIIQSGCLSGSDNYCMDKRLRNKPEQTISVISNNGLDCLYDVKFEE